MSIIDMICIAFLVYTVYSGVRRGLVKAGFDILGLVLSVLVAMAWYQYVAGLFVSISKLNPQVVYVLSFIVVSAVTYIIISLFGSTVQKLVRASFFGTVDMIGGGVLGFFKGAVIISIIMQLIFISPIVPILGSEFKNSMVTRITYPVITGIYSMIFPMLPKTLPNFQDFVQKFNKVEIKEDFTSIKKKKK
ncbi:MAG: CvpA family protein [bacterium]